MRNSNHSIHRALQVATSIIFLFILLAPIIQWRFGIFSYSKLQEFRDKAKWPGIPEIATLSQQKYQPLFESFFKDNYGFRDLLVKCKNQIDYSVFNLSDEVLIGKKHMLFYRSVVEKEEISMERASDSRFSILCENFLNLHYYLQTRGIQLVILGIPMKNTMYPENLPDFAPHRPALTVFQKLRAFLKFHPELAVLDSQELLEQYKSRFPLYYDTDFHWNDLTGSFVAEALVNKIAELSGSTTIWNRPRHSKTIPLSGGQNRSLAVFYPFIGNEIILKSASCTKKSDLIQQGGPNDWLYKTDVQSHHLPKTVIFGDSYANAFTNAGISCYFSQLKKFYNWDLKKQLKNIPPGTKFVVFQFVEVVLDGMLHDKFWPVFN